jgi:molecular chaperone GrpE
VSDRDAGEFGEFDRPVIRDKRRVDPHGETARVPDPAGSGDAAGTGSEAQAQLAAQLGEVEAQLGERTADLQRLQAEYANYRKRVERDRVAMSEQVVGGVVAAFLPVVDDIDRARAHGDLSGALKSVSEQLDAILGKLGLQAFGEVGDPFDPSQHEAVMHAESDTVTEPTATTVMRRGYRLGERLLRPAMVGVTDPSGPNSAGEISDVDPDGAASSPTRTPDASPAADGSA